ncbi:MAG TPA: hypothetical protein VKD65_16430 [Candidatus Angelobacter sp.]|nr:hypothetical protein [Candidatus Angelobacter sp.]
MRTGVKDLVTRAAVERGAPCFGQGRGCLREEIAMAGRVRQVIATPHNKPLQTDI